MPKGSEELTNARKEEIVNACAELYRTMGFKDISIRDIGEKTSFTRTSIYNYFHTKEEIFLALLKREHDIWAGDMEMVAGTDAAMDAESFADAVAKITEKRVIMLKLMSMNLYDMEVNSRLENLVDFKISYARAFDAMERCLCRYFPGIKAADRKEFIYTFFQYMFGVYPFTSHTEKQIEAMKQAGISNEERTIYEVIKNFIERLITAYM